MRHLLVTNDFPPKVGGIQSYLWELWRRLPPDDFAVLTTAHPDAPAWDARQAFRVERVDGRVLLPTPGLIRRIDALARELDAEIVVLDPVLPLGLVGPHLDRSYAVVLHGAEITVPGRLPGTRSLMNRVLGDARLVVAGGGYPLREAERAIGRGLPGVTVPPGVDTDRFRPLTAAQKTATRRRFGLDPQGPLVVSVSRLVPRKGMDVLIEATAALRSRIPDIQLAIAGDGRDRRRLERLVARLDAPTRLLGRVPGSDLPELYGCGDVFAMLCRNRWMGLEQEGFGIVFLEAAAAGVPQVAGRSGGAAEAVADGITGVVVDDPRSVDGTATAISSLLLDPERWADAAEVSRRRAVEELSYDVLARRLREALEQLAERRVA